MHIHQVDKDILKATIEQFHRNTEVKQRYASYDFCYGFFQTHRRNIARNMELSCLHLWAYLASWGMLRGSSKLLKECSMKALAEVVIYLSTLSDDDWELDLGLNRNGSFDETKSQRIINIYNELSEKVAKILGQDEHKENLTLVTKIMLGTLGCIPAFDQFFTETFRNLYLKECGFRTLSKNALFCIQNFYESNKDIIDSIKFNVINFEGNKTELLYSKSKLIDMYGFTTGFNNAPNMKTI